ncbi:CDP-diacylglycerol--serine O-phosphatidyltransferase [Hyphomicrobium nitrativorans NL23]|uniref:CDP-diacylglycerol--serine O-phosphatidyltransferase n=1 Tax=Hyphomicrobium nitrativorans NL23 TaxID=1029756 RepID=V5SHI9_9HYPH|nr:CDP-diacylglycerol--serine O-phosphatidyltransferase [Hyphomicrobium nitrativorans]AHB49525.1 CDP-diacylglycerol--serine O-phosphatidyltransferase [Hyphomicrobium nitrativorans NL23]
MDPIVPQLEKETRRRRRRRMFDHARIPVRMMVPNLFTLVGLCAGLTSIRMSIEGRYDFALAAIVFAALLDGLDGRVARLLKASSRFGAELDSLADFVNFGVAPAIMIFTWGLGGHRSLGWIAVMLFALASALRLARFNASLEDDKPKWQGDFFSGMPTPAAAIVVLLPIYLAQLGLDLRESPLLLNLVLAYTMVIGVMMVSNIPTYSGKLLGERIGREWVLPIFILVMLALACLVTYPYATLAIASIVYLGFIPWTLQRYRQLERLHAPSMPAAPPSADAEPANAADTPDTSNAEPSRVIEIRPSEQKR